MSATGESIHKLAGMIDEIARNAIGRHEMARVDGREATVLDAVEALVALVEHQV